MRVRPKARRPAAQPPRARKPLPNLVMPRHSTKFRPSSHTSFSTVDPAVVFNDLLPDLVESKNDFAWACCPFHDDNNPSFCVNLRTGWYRCFSSSCGESGANIGSFVSALLGLSVAEARKYMEATYG